MNKEHGKSTYRGRKGLKTLLVLLIAVIAILSLAVCQAEAKPSTSTTAKTYAYVTNQDDNTISVIDTSTGTVVATLNKIGTRPGMIVASHDGSRVYAAISGNREVLVLDTATNSKTFVNISNPVDSIAISPDDRVLYVATVAAIKIVDTSSLTVSTDLLSSDYFRMAVGKDGRTLYMGSSYPSHPIAYDLITRSQTPLPGTYGAGDVELSADGNYLYTTDGYKVNVIDAHSLSLEKAIPMGGTERKAYRLAVMPGTGLIYACDYDQYLVLIIDPAAGVVTGTINVWNNPVDLKFTPDGKQLYVVCEGSNRVAVIETATNAVTGTIPVGNKPEGVAICTLPSTGGSSGILLPTSSPVIATSSPSAGTVTPTATSMPPIATPVSGTPTAVPTAGPTEAPVTTPTPEAAVRTPTAEPVAPTPLPDGGRGGICGICPALVLPLLLVGSAMVVRNRRGKP